MVRPSAVFSPLQARFEIRRNTNPQPASRDVDIDVGAPFQCASLGRTCKVFACFVAGLVAASAQVPVYSSRPCRKFRKSSQIKPGQSQRKKNTKRVPQSSATRPQFLAPFSLLSHATPDPMQLYTLLQRHKGDQDDASVRNRRRADAGCQSLYGFIETFASWERVGHFD